MPTRRYKESWPKIPTDELDGSAVELKVTPTDKKPYKVKVLLHKRRMTQSQADGDADSLVCMQCRECLAREKPEMPPRALANWNWVGRVHPDLRKVNVAHRLLLARARGQTQKVMCRSRTQQWS